MHIRRYDHISAWRRLVELVVSGPINSAAAATLIRAIDKSFSVRRKGSESVSVSVDVSSVTYMTWDAVATLMTCFMGQRSLKGKAWPGPVVSFGLTDVAVTRTLDRVRRGKRHWRRHENATILLVAERELPELFAGVPSADLVDARARVRPSGQPNVNTPLTLLFSANEFDSGQITEVLLLLSELYRSVGGDSLVISDISFYSGAPVLAGA